MRARRRIPEVIQTSAMDCGPACLAALLGGYGVSASYERLREACQTDVDGTSIDTIEDAAVQLGLDAEQVIIPADHVLLAEAAALPAIVVLRLPGGSTHFVVAWRRARGRVLVMDPAIGRRWIRRQQLIDDLYIHVAKVPAEAWREWAGSDEMRRPLAERLRAIGADRGDAMIERALVHPDWQPIAALDAAVRMVQHLIDAGAMRPGAVAAKLAASLSEDADAIPEDMWSARAADEPDHVRVRGAVLVRARGHSAHAQPASVELRAALDERPSRPWRFLLEAIATGGALAPIAVLCAIAITSCLLVGETALWRTLFDTSELTVPQIAEGLATLVGFLVVELLLQTSLIGAVQRLGRRAELFVRSRFLTSIGSLGLRYLGSRPISDLTERSHALHRVGDLSWIAYRIIGTAFQSVLTGVALIVLAPAQAWLVAALVVATIAPPLLGHHRLAERELRARTHDGALARFYLDALLGAVPASAHGAERLLRREHEARLVEWVRAARREHALAIAIAGVQTALIVGLSIFLVAAHAASTHRPISVLLLVYWTITMAVNGVSLTALTRELPVHRNLVLRLLEPLGLRGDVESGETDGREVPSGEIVFDGVSVIAGGHTILDGISATIRAGEHVAIVGRSGAGKTTLLGLLLGWHRPASGTITVGGVPLDHSAIASLRTRTAWVDPAVHLWNDSLAANLLFGSRASSDLGASVVDAQLDGALSRLPEGLQTRLGEGGGLVAGGEGQRVRFGRALLRDRASLVVLDEPFRGLDRERRRELLATARARWRGSTLLCAIHDLAETREFDRVLVVEGGRVVEDSTPNELAAREGSRYAALLAEETATAALWNRWRTIRLESGRVVKS